MTTIWKEEEIVNWDLEVVSEITVVSDNDPSLEFQHEKPTKMSDHDYCVENEELLEDSNTIHKDFITSEISDITDGLIVLGENEAIDKNQNDFHETENLNVEGFPKVNIRRKVVSNPEENNIQSEEFQCKTCHKIRHRRKELVNSSADEPSNSSRDDGIECITCKYASERIVCELCEFKFYTEEEYKNHFIDYCVHNRKYKCDWCGKAYIKKENLQRHKRSLVHRDQCKICLKHFSSYSALKSHKWRCEKYGYQSDAESDSDSESDSESNSD